MWGLDGWVYACHGFSNTSKVKDRTGQVRIEMHSGNTYRFKPDGSRIENFTHGQVNPFGMAWDVAGNLYTADCHSRPIYQLLKGAWYPSFAKPHDGLGFGPEMLTHSHGSTAIAGIAVLADESIPEPFRHNVFIGNVVTNRINRDRIDWTGATPKAVELPDFVKCDDPWFRPVDIKLGPDGALYVADFYNRIIGHYEVPLDHPGRDRDKGRIWRIVYRGEKKEAPPRAIEDLTKLSTQELVARLRHGNLTVRMFAVNLLAERGGPDVVKHVNALLAETMDYPHAYGLWVLERLGVLEVPQLERALKASLNLTRIHAMRILAERDAWKNGARGLVLRGLADAVALVQRAAVEALAAHPDPDHIPILVDIRLRVPASDTHLTHAVRIALREQLKLDSAWALVAHADWSDKQRQAVADVCLGLRSPQAAAFLLKHLQGVPENDKTAVRYAQHIARYGAPVEGTDLLLWAKEKYSKDLSLQAALFRAVQQGRQESGRPLQAAERAWAEDLTHKLLASSDAAHIQGGIDLAAALEVRSVQPMLWDIVLASKAPEAQRKSAVAALIKIDPEKHLDRLNALLADAKQSPGLHEQIALSLSLANVPAAHALLAKMLETAPARLQTAIALGLAGSPSGGQQLLKAVEAGKCSARLLQEVAIQQRLFQAKIPKLKERLAKLTKGLPSLDQRVYETISKKRAGFVSAKADVAAGAKLFEKHCASCHQLANKGSKIGPQLDGIGVRGLERLLEDLLDPSRNVDQAFRATTLVLKNGQVVVGLFLRQDGEVLVLADSAGKEQRVSAAAVDDRVIAPLSPMPGNFAEQLRDEELFDLLAFLLDQRTK